MAVERPAWARALRIQFPVGGTQPAAGQNSALRGGVFLLFLVWSLVYQPNIEVGVLLSRRSIENQD